MMGAEIERLAARVRGAARHDGLIETAQVKLLGLDEVRTAAGPRWPRMREHVREGSIRIIAQRIGPDDAVIPCGDGFLVVFAEATGEETQARCVEIREALVAFYLGEEALQSVRADVDRETVTASRLANLVSDDAAKPRPELRNDLKLGRFWPVWSARRLAVAAHLCGPCVYAAKSPRLGYSADFLGTGGHEACDHLDLDLCLLEQACTAAELQIAPIGVTVHSTTMQVRKSRSVYLEHLAANLSPAHQRMFIMIAEIAPGTPLMSLTDWTRCLKQQVPRIALDLHHRDRAISAIGSTGAWAAGYHLPAHRIVSAAQTRTALNEIDSLCRGLRKQGLMPLVNGFQDAALLDLAAYSELAFATGEQLWPSQTAPQGLAAATRTRPTAPIQ